MTKQEKLLSFHYRVSRHDDEIYLLFEEVRWRFVNIDEFVDNLHAGLLSQRLCVFIVLFRLIGDLYAVVFTY